MEHYCHHHHCDHNLSRPGIDAEYIHDHLFYMLYTSFYMLHTIGYRPCDLRLETEVALMMFAQFVYVCRLAVCVRWGARHLFLRVSPLLSSVLAQLSPFSLAVWFFPLVSSWTGSFWVYNIDR